MHISIGYIMEKYGICGHVTSLWFSLGIAEGEKHKQVGLQGTYSTSFHGDNQLIVYKKG